MAMNPRLLRPKATFGFDPKTVPGLAAWWDAADSSSVTLDSGRVSTLADKSGNGRNASNSTSGSTQPDYVTAARNGRNVVRFAGASTQRLNVASSTATFKFLHDGTSSYVALVASFGNTADPNALMSIFGSAGWASAQIGISAGYDDRASTGSNNNSLVNIYRGSFATVVAVTTNAIVPQTTTVVEYLIDADNATAANRMSKRFNGGASSTPNTNTDSASASNASYDFQLGCGGNNAFPLTGDICEVLIYSQHPTADSQAAIRRYLARKWGITLYSPPAYADADVNAYITAVEAADAQALETGVRDAINTFITGCKSDGIWTAIKASCILMGARTLSGALTPLVGTAPTNNGPFVSGDYNRKTGLVGNGTSKYLNTNRNASTADQQNNHHISALPTELPTEDAVVAGTDFGPLLAARASGTGAGSLQLLNTGANSATPNLISFVSTNAAFSYAKAAGTFTAASRSASGSFTSRVNNASSTNTDASQSLANANYLVFARTVGGTGEKYSKARIAFYSIGESLNLALLDSRVSTLYTAIGAAIP